MTCTVHYRFGLASQEFNTKEINDVYIHNHCITITERDKGFNAKKTIIPLDRIYRVEVTE